MPIRLNEVMKRSLDMTKYMMSLKTRNVSITYIF